MIKTWQQRCEKHPDHDGIVSEGMIQARMQEEIDELRTQRQWKGLTAAERVNVAISCGCADVAWMAFADAIEAELKAKNS